LYLGCYHLSVVLYWFNLFYCGCFLLEPNMNYPVELTGSVTPGNPDSPPVVAPQNELSEILKQILEIQKEMLNHQRAALAAHDHAARWKSFISRWPDDFPGLPEMSKNALPHLEKAYGKMIYDIVERISDDSDCIDNEFGLQEFLDRYGMRLAQIGTLLNLVAPLADLGNNPES